MRFGDCVTLENSQDDSDFTSILSRQIAQCCVQKHQTAIFGPLFVVKRAGMTALIIARTQQSRTDPYFAFEHQTLFDIGMRVSGVT